MKADRRVPPGLQSCHTATADGFTVGGHVPAADVKRMLRERPPVVGIGVGGMPAGSPGMPGAPEPYAVEASTDAGAAAVYAEH